MSEQGFILVSETKPNNFEPIYWTSTRDLYNLKKIDEFTSKYTILELKEHLINSNILPKEYVTPPLQIIYNDNGNRRLKYGLITKEEYSKNMLQEIKEFIIYNKENSNLLNNFIQKIKSEKIVTNNTKNILNTIFKSRTTIIDLFKILVSDLDNINYIDERTLYLCIKTNFK